MFNKDLTWAQYCFPRCLWKYILIGCVWIYWPTNVMNSRAFGASLKNMSLAIINFHIFFNMIRKKCMASYRWNGRHMAPQSFKKLKCISTKLNWCLVHCSNFENEFIACFRPYSKLCRKPELHIVTSTAWGISSLKVNFDIQNRKKLFSRKWFFSLFWTIFNDRFRSIANIHIIAALGVLHPMSSLHLLFKWANTSTNYSFYDIKHNASVAKSGFR
jgi:hypothetical protein